VRPAPTLTLTPEPTVKPTPTPKPTVKPTPTPTPKPTVKVDREEFEQGQPLPRNFAE